MLRAAAFISFGFDADAALIDAAVLLLPR